MARANGERWKTVRIGERWKTGRSRTIGLVQVLGFAKISSSVNITVHCSVYYQSVVYVVAVFTIEFAN